MNKVNIEKAGLKAGLSGKLLETFVLFFSRRFPDEANNIISYVDTWANRFANGEPKTYMDMISIDVYSDILVELEAEEKTEKK